MNHDTECGRRTVLATCVLSVGSVAGCVDSGGSSGEDPSTADEDAPEDDGGDDPETTSVSPWGDDPIVVGLRQDAAARRGFADLVERALAYWEDNAGRYAGYQVTYEFRANAEDPDVRIRLVEEVEECGEHTGDFSGCAPLVRDRAPDRTLDVRIVDGYGDEATLATIKHELGHTLGLNHDDEPSSIMSHDPADRIPDYEAKRRILERHSAAVDDANEGADHLDHGTESFNEENYETAREHYREARGLYRDHNERTREAIGIGDGIGARDAVELLEDALEFGELNVERTDHLAAAADDMVDGRLTEANDDIKKAKDVRDRLEDVEYPGHDELARALDLPLDRDGSD